MFYITHAHSTISANSANSINCVDGAAAQLVSDLSASRLVSRIPIAGSVVDQAVRPKKPCMPSELQ